MHFQKLLKILNCILTIKTNQSCETIISRNISNKCFLKVDIDVMTFPAKDYFVILNYYFKYSKLQCLYDKMGFIIVDQSKSVFAHYSIPVKIISENMPF